MNILDSSSYELFRLSMRCWVLTLLLIILSPMSSVANTVRTSAPMSIDISNDPAFANLSTASYSQRTAGKTMVITSIMDCNNLTIPSDRSIEVRKGGRIRYSGNLVINGPFDAGLYQALEKVSSGAVTGLREVRPEWFGAAGNATVGASGVGADDTKALNMSVAALVSGGEIRLHSTYRTTASMTYPLMSSQITMISNTNGGIYADHNGDAIKWTSKNENYGGHRLIGVTLTGPNTHFPSNNYLPPSTGAGIRMHSGGTNNVSAYGNVIRDCKIYGFKYGLLMQAAIGVVVDGYSVLRWNQYGVYIDGGQTNGNKFIGTMIRENRKAGIYSAGTSGGALTNATNNSFISCLIESNIPYPYVPGGHAPDDSVAIYLKNSYDFVFQNSYSENHQYSVYLTGSSKGNKFISHRMSPSSDYSRLDGVILDGPNIYNNIFSLSKINSRNRTDAHVESNDDSQLYNQFLDCEGFNFIASKLVSKPFVSNLRPSADWANVEGYGAIVMPTHGYKPDPTEGKTPGTITGIGTSTATLNANGFGEVLLSSQIAAGREDTTITTFTGLKPGQIFVLWNYQDKRTVTIKHGGAIGNIVLKPSLGSTLLDNKLHYKPDALMNNYGQMIVFYVNSLGRAYEIGRNF